LSPGEFARRARRHGRFGDGAAEGASEAATNAARTRLERLSTVRFSNASPSLFFVGGDDDDINAKGLDDLETRELAWDAFTVRGTCVCLEKSYFRLTSAPDPKTVRPKEVLTRALSRLRAKETEAGSLAALENDRNRDYRYLNDQLKAIRQDLVVQRVRDDFTVSVYEHHARVALRNDDLGEFNQCQTALRELYREGKDGEKEEFLAYRVLYGAVTNNATGSAFVAVLGEAAAFANANRAREPSEDETRVCVSHALAARRALAEQNICDWFRLFGAAKQQGAGTRENFRLMRVKTEEIRFQFLTRVSRSFRPHVPVAFLAKNMGFTLDAEDADARGPRRVGSERNPTGLGKDGAPRIDLREPEPSEIDACADWLRARGAVLVTEDGALQVDAKASVNTLFVPEDTDAVAHGDRTLAVEDFLARAVGDGETRGARGFSGAGLGDEET
jgi:hypothetical protein